MASSIARAARQITSLADGTALSVGLADGTMTLSAPGLKKPITITLPMTGLTVDEDLRWRLAMVTDSVRERASYDEPHEPDACFWLAHALLTAGESGISL